MLSGGPTPATRRLGDPQLGPIGRDRRGSSVARRVAGLRLFAGRATGQFEDEIEVDGGYLLPALALDVATTTPDRLGQQVLGRQDWTLATVSSLPDDPSPN